ncbi:MAG: Gfo/Idh/MocA family oxidoreductase [Candidatus Omnitrophota bacterium]|nr:Gfo/Idh/MocA family oxidoreductase [Candidatus Omnitrophota bacterium]
MIKVGIIGCGKITERASLPNLASYKDKCEVTCLCDVIESRAEEMKDKFKLDNVDIVTNWKKLVKKGDIDVVFVNTPNYLHEKMAVGAAKNKKHILVEKPITISLKAADKMIGAAEKAGVFLMVEQTQRFDPVHQSAKKALDSGVLGKIHNIRGRIGHAGPEYWSEGKGDWYYDKKKSGGGCMVDIGVHIADLIRWFKVSPVVEVFARIQTLEKDIPVDDNATILLKFEDGTEGEFECSWTTRPYEVLTYVYGEKGKMTTNIGSKQPVVITQAKTGQGEDANCVLAEEHPEIGPGGAWENAIHYFIDCIREKQKPFVSGQEGMETLRIILAAYKSNKKGKWVKVGKQEV